jgi:hypothetical protein
MRQVADLLREALRRGDEQSRSQIRGRHLPERLWDDLASQTHRYALEHSEDAGSGWLVFKEGISGWWTREGGLADGEFNRLYMLRADVVKRLTEQGLALRQSPRSTPLYVRRSPAAAYEPTAGTQ